MMENPYRQPHVEIYFKGAEGEETNKYLRAYVDEYDRLTALFYCGSGIISVKLLGGGEATIRLETISSIVLLSQEQVDFLDLCDKYQQQKQLFNSGEF